MIHQQTKTKSNIAVGLLLIISAFVVCFVGTNIVLHTIYGLEYQDYQLVKNEALTGPYIQTLFITNNTLVN